MNNLKYLLLLVLVNVTCFAQDVRSGTLSSDGFIFVENKLVKDIELELSEGEAFKELKKIYKSGSLNISLSKPNSADDDSNGVIYRIAYTDDFRGEDQKNVSRSVVNYLDARLRGFSPQYSKKLIFENRKDLVKSPELKAFDEYSYVLIEDLKKKSDVVKKNTREIVYHLTDEGGQLSLKYTILFNEVTKQISIFEETLPKMEVEQQK